MGRLTPKNIFKIFNPFTEFLRSQSLSGYLLLIATLVAIIIANSPWGDSFIHFWEIPIHITLNNSTDFHFTLEEFINDGLMTIFFTVVGLEIKRELIEGHLSTKEKALLPVVGAFGGMFFPAIIYAGFNLWGNGDLTGWAIPTATDIAFSLTVISLLGNRVPLSLKVFLTALAVVDDLGAIVVIALVYSNDTHLMYLLYTALVVALLIYMNYRDVRNIWLYLFVGIFLWVFLHHAGVHATIAGVILALTVPFRYANYQNVFNTKLQEVMDYAQLLISSDAQKDHAVRDQVIEQMQIVSTEMEAPLNNMLYKLVGFSSYVIMPLFALSNAGVKLDIHALDNVGSNISLGILFGLIIGKPFGITLTTWFTTKLGITSKPANVRWKEIFSINILAGIGFTMSIFVTKLAFTENSNIETAKFSIIIASFLSGIVGFLILKSLYKNNIEEETENIGH